MCEMGGINNSSVDLVIACDIVDLCGIRLTENLMIEREVLSVQKISIVMPSFNQGPYLDAAIRSVLDQNYPAVELIVIDGGLSKAYQEVTGIAGYTLIFNSHGMLLTAHEPFTSSKDAYEHNVELISDLSIVNIANKRILVGDTDIGKKVETDINDLKMLLAAYRQGFIKTLLY